MNSFDYIIVGAGSAGCVLANRLTEDAACKVLLIEAGGKDRFHTSIPGAYAFLHRSSLDWAFWTEPQPHVNNRRLFIPRGKVLGGCSTTNAMAYVRGNPQDYNEWAARGNNGWGFADVLPYFIKSENHDRFNGPFHGKNGPLNVGFAQYPSPLSSLFVKACAERGIETNEDYNGVRQSGASMLQYTISNNRRQSTAKAFLETAMHRPNLVVRTNVLVKKVVIEKERAIGVELVTGRRNSENVFSKKEVIISAGSIKSPQLLMLSGIGDRDGLTKAGVEIKIELPGVGKNLQDHVWTYASNLTNIPTSNSDIKPFNMVKAAAQYFALNKGALCNSPIEANAFINTTPGASRPDIQYHFTPFFIGDDYKTDIYDFKTLPYRNGFSIMVILLRPESRGVVTIKSNSPFDAPVIDPNFLHHDKDVNTLIAGLKKAMEVANANIFKQFSPEGLHHPKREADDESLRVHIRKSLETLYHPVGTCKMGNDAMSVVNEKLQVHGVNGLRVIDASIMPSIICGNTNAPAIMIGEKGADLIKTDSL